MINILDRANIFDILSHLHSDEKPRFGAMSPQHMVEHLAFSVRFSNGKEPQKHYYSPEKEQKIKTYILDTDNDFMIGFKAPVLPPEGLPELHCADLDEAISALKNELGDFDRYFEVHPAAQPINPTMGELNYREWVRFHNRHFSHHFKQFGLL
ncbi:MAG: hypothetical protein KF870_15600 [Leadbetterella sp.]|nr:hypothetical protein [Leadbetterella sp.]